MLTVSSREAAKGVAQFVSGIDTRSDKPCSSRVAAGFVSPARERWGSNVEKIESALADDTSFVTDLSPVEEFR